MKNIFKSIMCIAAAAMAFTACSTADINEEITAPQTITVKFNALAENMTRTTFGGYDSTNNEYPTLWEANDQVKASLGVGNGATSEELTEGGQNASFDIKFNANTIPAEGPYTLYAVSPASAVSSSTLAAGNKFNITIPDAQTPTPESCDAAAQILYGKSEESANIPTNASFTLHHAVAYMYFSLSNLPAGATTIHNIEISSESNIAGQYTLAFDGTLTDNGASKSIAVDTSSATGNYWVALAPGAVEALTFTVTTNAGIFEKTVNIPVGKSFEAGKIAGFTVNMSGAAVKYKLLTDVTDLDICDYVIIAAAEANYAIGAQGDKNRTATAVTKDGDYIVNPSSSVEIFTVGEGIVENTYSLQNWDGTYIYAASSSSNHLKSESNLTANSSWDITVDNTGVATITAQGTHSRNIIRYNNSGGSNLFSCYASTSPVQGKVAIYYQSNGGVVPPKPPVINANDPEAVAAEATTITIPYTVSNSVGGKELQVTESVDWVSAYAVDNKKVTLTITANESEEPRNATITLSYEGATDKVVTISQEGAPDPGTGTEKTATFTFGNMSLTNATAYTDFTDGDITVTFALGSNPNGNKPKYYSSDSTMRIYTGNTMEFSKATTSTATSVTITNIDITATSSSTMKVGLTDGQPGTTSTSNAVMSWTGESASVSFTASDTSRFRSVVVTYIAE